MKARKRRTALLLFSLVGTFLLIRTYLHLSPNTDFNILGYNIHHLFTGLLLLTIGGVPLVVLNPEGKLGDLSVVVFGVGLSLALDEWVYLITTDGSNASYLLPISFWGGVLAILLTALYILLVHLIGHK